MFTFLCKVDSFFFFFCGRGVTRPGQHHVSPPLFAACFSCLRYNKIPGMNLGSRSLHGLCWGGRGGRGVIATTENKTLEASSKLSKTTIFL